MAISYLVELTQQKDKKMIIITISWPEISSWVRKKDAERNESQ